MNSNIIIQLLIFIVIGQSCAVYQDLPVSLSEAHNQGKGKLVYKAGDLIKFQNIMQEDSVSYFVLNRERKKNLNGEYEWSDTRINLDSATISVILLKDIKKSRKKTTLFVVVGIPAAWVLVMIGAIIVFVIPPS